MPQIWSTPVSAASDRAQRMETWMFDGRYSLWGVAACRILTALSVLGLLLSNVGGRDIWVGQASVWAESARAVSAFPELTLLRNVSGDVLTVVYLATMLAAVALLLGWHTWAANVLTLIGFIAIVGQNPVVGTQGDNVVRLTLLWLLLMRSAEHWSLDARRRSRADHDDGNAVRRAWAGGQMLPAWLSTGLHNIGLIGLAAQTVLIYMTSGLDKVSRAAWQDGTALYYTMQLPEYRPFPPLSDALSSSTAVLAVVTYVVLAVQLFFGPLLLNASSRRVLLAAAVLVNVLFAVLFAQPWSSLAVIGVTCLFVSATTFQIIDARARRALRPLGDWLVERGYDVLDRLDDVRYGVVFPVVDWVRSVILRR